MKCDKCQSERLKYDGSIHTLVAYSEFVDADGYKHHHDMNRCSAIIKCRDCDHEMRIAAFNRCSNHCGWTSEFPDKIYHTPKPYDPNDIPKGVKFGPSKIVILNDKHMMNLRPT